jgi:serine/threonine protein kinase
MGIVYEAEQEYPRRRVALKVIRGGLDDERRLRLFEREMQALARLRHPSIAAIYQAGQTDDGQPFFAMELAHGAPWAKPCVEAGRPRPSWARSRHGCIFS